MSRLFDALLDDLAGEITRRDPRFADLFPPQLPTVSEIEAMVSALIGDGADRERVTELAEAGIAELEKRGLAGRRRGTPDRLGRILAQGIIDCALADEGLLDLAPTPRDARALEEVLRVDYAAAETPSGRRYWVRRSPRRKLLVVSALGIPIEYWRPLITDRHSGFAPILAETRCGDLFSGGMDSDAGLEAHADDLIEILEAVGEAPIDVLAWCNGGRIAIDLASRRPDLIRSLTLLGPTLRGDTGPTSDFENLLQKIFEAARANPAFAAPMTRMLGQFFSVKEWDRSAADADLPARQFLGLPDAAHARGLMAPMSTGEALLNYAARTAKDEAYAVQDTIARLAMPVLLITGDCDSVVSNARTLQAMAAVRDLRHVQIAGCGHYIQHLQYPSLRACLSAFVAGRAMRTTARMRVSGDSAAAAPAVPEWWYRSRAPGRRGVRYPLSRLFAWPAAVKPLAPAIADAEVRLDFGELERGSRNLAARLRALGVARGDNILVLSEKRACMAVVAGGIWKALATYVPVDAKNPDARLANIVAQVEPAAVIGSAARLAQLGAFFGSVPTLSFDDVMAGCRGDPLVMPDEPGVAADEDAPAYVIFTSGSTGSPKGVTISHASLLDYFYNHNQVLRFGPGSRVFSLAPFHFDISIEDTLLPLSLGAFVYQFNGLPIGQLMRQLLAREGITHLIAVSTLLALITDDGSQISQDRLPELEMVMTGAEECDPRLIDLWVDRLPAARVINAYGPTEATIVCMTHTIARPERDRAGAYPIGRPLPGVTAMILDEEGRRIATPDVPGELLIGGSQVMLGYLGLPEETARACPEIDGRRYYRTGDRCHVDRSGRYVFDGRLDDMVKITGRRIHLGEIRHAAMAAGQLQRAAVGTCEHGGTTQICLVAISRFETRWSQSEMAALRSRLADMLPDYMVPRVIGTATEAVVTGNGKSDDGALLSQLAEAALEMPDKSDFHLIPGRGFAAPAEEIAGAPQ